MYDVTLTNFENYLLSCEKSSSTVKKYIRDVLAFLDFTKGRSIDKSLVLCYKERLGNGYAVASANSMIAAVNAYLRYIDKGALCIKQFKTQRDSFCPEETELTRNEYIRLVMTAKQRNNERLALLIETICTSGIRVSELDYVTVEAVNRGYATVNCKGKSRKVFIVTALCRKLTEYARSHSIASGAVFVTRNGKALDRCNIWREMKKLCKYAKVSEQKVFPHNLRHLFARTFYEEEKDIAALADILGHSSINTTRIYTVSSGTEHRRKMENMRLVLPLNDNTK